MPFTPSISAVADCPSYEQDEPGLAEFKWLIPEGELDGVVIGHVQLTGPIHKTPAAHAGWDQVYLVFEGRATIHLAGEDRVVRGPAVVRIPRGTRHSVEVAAGDEIRYAFINRYLDAERE